MSSFFARNKTQTSQICEGDKYPTIGAVLTTLSMCISSMRPTTACSVVKDASTVTATNRSLTQTASRVSGDISMISREKQVSFSPSSCWGHNETLYDVWLLSSVVQERISCADHAVNFRWQITTDIGSWQNKAGNAGLTPDACDPEHLCNWQDRGWIRHHPRCWRPGLVEGRRKRGQARFPLSLIPVYSCR